MQICNVGTSVDVIILRYFQSIFYECNIAVEILEAILYSKPYLVVYKVLSNRLDGMTMVIPCYDSSLYML